MKQNASMDTIWCRGELRIVIWAKNAINKGEPIVLDYDEYKDGPDAPRPYFDTESMVVFLVILVFSLFSLLFYFPFVFLLLLFLFLLLFFSFFEINLK